MNAIGVRAIGSGLGRAVPHSEEHHVVWRRIRRAETGVLPLDEAAFDGGNGVSDEVRFAGHLPALGDELAATDLAETRSIHQRVEDDDTRIAHGEREG